MVKLVLLFRHTTAIPNFDLRFRRNLDLLKQMPGVLRLQENRVLGGPAGEARYQRVLEVYFESAAALDGALTSPEGVTAGKDLMAYAGAEVELLFVEDVDQPAPQPLGPHNLESFLAEKHISARIIYPGVPTPTVPDAARALEVEPDQIVKSMIFIVDERPFLVYACGTRRVDTHKLAARLNVAHKRVKAANADQVLELTGYEVGAVPPLGLKTPMPAFMDPAVQTHDIVYAGGGGKNALLQIATTELLRASSAEIAPMLEDEKSN
jgi:uncharacterized protein (TIGR02118 family)